MKSLIHLKSRPPNSGGFTLIEMLIVVAIIAILVAIAVPALNRAKQDAQETKQQAINGSVAHAKIRYALDTEGTEGQNAQWDQFSTYMLYNGKTPDIEELAYATENDVGLNITSWGTYPDSEGAATEVVWGTTAAVTD